MEKYNLEQTGQQVQKIINEATPQSELTAETERAQLAEQQLQNDIDAIEEKIPSGASSSNKLATEEYVDDSVSTATATFRGTFNLVSDLGLTVDATEQQIAAALASEISTADNNDYCFVQIPTSAETPTEIEEIDRYKFNGTAWSFEYELNNSGFTADQWDAINSHVTSGDVAKLLALPTNAELTILLNGKQDVLTFDNVPTENSNNPVKSGGVKSAIDDEKGARLNGDADLQQSIDGINGKIPNDASSENKLATASDVDDEATARSNADQSLQDAIEAILLLIPTAASSLNQLADKAFVNSSIATNTATFRGTFNLVNDLHLTLAATHAQVGNALALAILDSDNNDYCFVQIPTVETAPTEIAQTDRYKFNGSTWEYEYTLNNSGFTSAQWIAINSGITSVLVSKLSELPTNSELTSEFGALTTAINNINLKIPSAAAQNNKLVDTAALESYIVQVLGVLTVTYNVTSSDGHVTFHIAQTDGKITAVTLTTNDIASANDLTVLAGRVTTAENDIDALEFRVGTNEADIALLQAAYGALTQSDIIIGALPASGVANKIYRVPGTSSYSDYMWNGTQFVLMATYNNAIDPRPKKDSTNLVESGGVFDNMGALDISELNATENPHTLATYADLSAALAAIPSNDYKKGGMSVKFVQTDDNKYVQYRLMTQDFSTNVVDWSEDGGDSIIDIENYVGIKLNRTFTFESPITSRFKFLYVNMKAGVTYNIDIKATGTSSNTNFVIGYSQSSSDTIAYNINSSRNLDYTPNTDVAWIWAACYVSGGTFDVTVYKKDNIKNDIQELQDFNTKVSVPKINSAYFYVNKTNSGFTYRCIDSLSEGGVLKTGIYLEEGKRYVIFKTKADNLSNFGIIVGGTTVSDLWVNLEEQEFTSPSTGELTIYSGTARNYDFIIKTKEQTDIKIYDTNIIDKGIKYSINVTSVIGSSTLFIQYPFRTGNEYIIDLTLSNIVLNEGQTTINFCIDKSNTSEGNIFNNISSSTELLYRPVSDHEYLYVRAYNGSCDASAIISISKNTDYKQTFVIAANDAPNKIKSVADYVCDGTNDQVEINSAIAALPSTGGEIHLSCGTFNLTSPIVVKKDLTISGEGHGPLGIAPTLLKSTSSNAIEIGEAGHAGNDKLHLTFRDFQIRGDHFSGEYAGIYAIQGFDGATFENIGIYQFRVGIFVIEPGSNIYSDLTTFFNVSIQWCGCAIICNKVMVTNFISCCFADGFGLTTFKGTSYNCSGLYIKGDRNIIQNCHFVSCNKRTEVAANKATSVVDIVGNNIIVDNNYIQECYATAVVVTGPRNRISNNYISRFGQYNISGNNSGVKLIGDKTIVSGNKIGALYDGVTGENYVGIDSDANFADKNTIIRDNVFDGCLTSIDDTYFGQGVIQENNIDW